MNHDQALQLIVAQQQEIYLAVWVSNWLAVAGRVIDLGILWLAYRCWVLLRKK